MALTWSKHGPDMVPYYTKLQGPVMLVFFGFNSKFDTFHISKTKSTVEIAKTLPFYGPNIVQTWYTYLVLPES